MNKVVYVKISLSYVKFWKNKNFWKQLTFLRSVPYLVEGGCPRGVMVKALDCEIVMSEFEFQSRYYVHFRKGMNPLILPAMG